MFRTVIDRAMSEQGMKPLQIGGNNFLTSSSKHDDTWTLRIGDQISVYMDTNTGYAFMSANGIESYNARCGAVETSSKSQLPSNFKECVFVVHNPNQYPASNAFYKKLDSLGLKDYDFRNSSRFSLDAANEKSLTKQHSSANVLTNSSSSKNLKRDAFGGSGPILPSTSTTGIITNIRSPSALMAISPTSGASTLPLVTRDSENSAINSQETYVELKTLQLKMEKEREQNRIEAERSIGKVVLYGQAIQLLHLKTNKFLTVARESAEMQKDCMRLILDEKGNSNSIFHIIPYYKFRTEGQKVLISDQIRLMNRKSSQYVHLSPYKYKHENRREINMSTDVKNAKWRLRLFTPFLGIESQKNLKAGDVIRFYHKEVDGYLTVDSTKTNVVKIRSDQDDESKNSSNTMWEVEHFDPSRGGSLTWNNMYRLKHVASNRYMTVRVPVIHDSDSESSDDEDSSNLASTKSGDKLLDDDSDKIDKDYDNDSAGSSTPRDLDDLDDEDEDYDSDDLMTPRTAMHERKRLSIANMNGSMFNLNQARKSTGPTANSKWHILRKKIMKDKALTDSSSFSVSETLKKFELYIDEPTTSSTLFTICPPNKSKGNIPLDGFIRVRHNHTNSWIHAVARSNESEDFGGRDTTAAAASTLSIKQKQTRQLQSSKKRTHNYTKVETTSVMFEEDVLVVKQVSQEQVDDLLFIQSINPVLDNMIQKLRTQRPLKKTECHNVTNAFTQLILFCTESDVMDPMKREGIPRTNRQNYLREQKVVDRVMEILRLPFEKGYLKPEEIHEEKHFAYKELFRYAYRFIKQSCKLNRANGLYMSPYIGFIQSQIEYGIGVSSALTEILSNNYELLNKITEDEIKFFINLLFSSNKSSDYLGFLCALCDVNSNPVPKNQDFIAQILFNDDVNARETLMIPFLTGDQIKVMIEGREVDLKIFTMSALAQSSTGIRSTRRYDKNLLEFLQNAIELLGKLCMGRNMKSISIVSNLLSFEMILSCIEDDSLPEKLRSNFCKLLLYCYIDTTPFEKKPIVILTRNWTPQNIHNAQEKRKLQKKTAYVMDKMKHLKSFIDKFYSTHHELDKSKLETNKFILTLTRVCKMMFEFGIYSDIDEISSLIEKLFKVLDGKTDKYFQKPMQDNDRFVMDEQNVVVSAIKLEICKLFNIMFDIAQNRRISYFMEAFKHRIENERLFQAYTEDNRRDEEILSRLFGYNERNEKPSTILDSPDFKRKMYAVMQDLMNYGNQDLANSAMNLLFRAHNQKEELYELLPRIELLVSRQMIRSYNELNKSTSKLRQLLAGESSSRLRGQEANRVRELMENIVKDCRENGQRSQRILRNLQAHELALATLQRTFNDSTTQSMLWRWSTRLLTEFVRSNQDNQIILFRHLEFLISRLGVITDMCGLLCEIVKNNAHLCSTIEEKHVRYFIDTIAENGLSARYLTFLRYIVSNNGKPLKSNQTIVTKNLMERKKDVMKLFSDEEGIRERNRRIQNNEHIIKPDGILNYHINLLQLLCDCADGKNHVSEVKLQALLSIDVLLEQLTESVLIPELRDPLIRFLDEVYINTEKENPKLQSTPKLWQLFERVNKEIEHFLKGPKISKRARLAANNAILENYRKARAAAAVKSPKADSDTSKMTASDLKDKLKLNISAAIAPSSSAPTEPNISSSELIIDDEKYYVDNHYIYKLAIPLIHHYYYKHFPPPLLTEQQQRITEQLIYNLTSLYSKTANPNQREALKKCVQAMYKKNLKIDGAAKSHIDQFLARVISDTSKPVEIHRGTTNRSEEKDEQICNQYSSYIKLLKHKLLARSDLRNVATLYSDQKDLDTFVKVLRSMYVTGYDEASIFATIRALRTLQTVMENTINEDDKDKLKETLERMVHAKAPALVLELVCCNVKDIVKEAFELGILLLVDGNLTCQSDIYDIFTNNPSESFFVAIRDRIRLAIREIKDRKSFMKKRMGKLKALSESNRVTNLAELKVRDPRFIKNMQEQLTIAQGHSRMKQIELLDMNSSSQVDLKQIVDSDKFEETGYIQQILRFLQLMCEGHNGNLQNYLNTQAHNNLSVNLVQECLQYLLALEKFVDSHTINIAIQSYDTLTEFVQGPCANNQHVLGLSPKLYFASNDLLHNESLEKDMPMLPILKLRYKIILTLTSLLEGNRDRNLYALMRSSLNITTIQDILLYCAKVRTGSEDQQLLERAHKDKNIIEKQGGDSLPAEKIQVKMKKYYERLGLHIYFLLNMFRDQKSFKEEADESLNQWFIENEAALAGFQAITGRIEILRNNFIERVYFRKPDISNNMIEQTKRDFLYNCSRESAQSKIYALFNETNKFRIEMEHYETFRASDDKIKGKKASPDRVVKSYAWNFVEKNWSLMRRLYFFYSVLLNIIVCCTYKKTFDPEKGGIPIPGESTTSSNGIKLTGAYTYGAIEYVMFFLGLFQLVMTTFLFVLYMYFYAKLKVKKQFSIQKDTKWEKMEFNFDFVKNYIRFSLVDTQMWSFFLLLAVSVIGFAGTPLAYCILLFEVVARAPTLRTVLLAIQNNVKPLALTGVLMIFTIFFFSILYFSWAADGFVLETGEKLCNTQWQCFVAIMNYGLRGGGFWEDILPAELGPLRFVIDMLFFFVVIIVLINIVFGIILDAFDDLRQEREKTEKLVKDRCFICDIERARFDMKANEGITFEKHIKQEHYMWNYVFFLIYLYKKKKTEYTGVEQYIFNLAQDDDPAFFPILRSLTLEESDAKSKNRQQLNAYDGGGADIYDVDYDFDLDSGTIASTKPSTGVMTPGASSTTGGSSLERKNSFNDSFNSSFNGGGSSFSMSFSNLKKDDK